MTGRFVAALAFGLVLVTSAAPSSAVNLTGTIRDFCAPSISGTCTQLTDFEGAVTGVVTNMVGTTLGGDGLPTVGANIAAGASSAANFAKWFNDSPGFNASAPFSLPLSEGPPGTFTFSSGAFFPIDGQLFGNQGRGNNFHFTLHLEGQLSFSNPTTGNDFNFNFTGDDDLWIFVGGKRVIDLGGVHGAASANFTEETLVGLGLAPGVNHSLDIFFAERHTTASTFAITSTLTLLAPPPPPPPTGVPEPATMTMLGVALGGLAYVQRRRRR